MYRTFNPGVRVRIPAGQQWMNSSMAERWLVKPMVESSPESFRDSSSKTPTAAILSVVEVSCRRFNQNCECGEVGESRQSVKLLPKGLTSSILVTHTSGESPDGRGDCLENSWPKRFGGSIPSLSANNGGLAERLMQWFAKPSSGNWCSGSNPLLSANVLVADMAYAFDCKSKRRKFESFTGLKTDE